MKTLLLVYDKNYIYFPSFRSDKIIIEPLWKDRKYQYCFWTKVFRKLHVPAGIWFPFYGGDWIKRINSFDKIVVFDAVYEPVVGNWLKKYNIPVYIYMWDGKNRDRLSQKQLFPVLSFNPRDIQLGMIYQQGFYYKDYVKDIPRSEEFDIFYCGRLKNRTEEVKKICMFLVTGGFSVYFHIVSDQEADWEGKIFIRTDELTYRENIEHSAKSKAILNIVNPGELGTITLRCLEALYLEKKLITNDKEICKLDFYDPRNIFVLDNQVSLESQLEELKRFMEVPYHKPPQEILDKYDMNNACFG